jgi:zinc finger SWIM domain-containing protein 3
MTLFELVEHFDHYLSRMRVNVAILDFVASSSLPCLQPDASIIKKEAAKSFTPSVFSTVQFSIKAAKRCFAIEIEDGYDTIEYTVGRKDKGDIEYHVVCEICVDEGNLMGISCSCLKLQSLGTPSHTFSLYWKIVKSDGFRTTMF